MFLPPGPGRPEAAEIPSQIIPVSNTTVALQQTYVREGVYDACRDYRPGDSACQNRAEGAAAFEVVFSASLAPLGWSSFLLVPGKKARGAAASEVLDVDIGPGGVGESSYKITNGITAVTFSRDTGRATHIQTCLPGTSGTPSIEPVSDAPPRCCLRRTASAAFATGDPDDVPEGQIPVPPCSPQVPLAPIRCWTSRSGTTDPLTETHPARSCGTPASPQASAGCIEFGRLGIHKGRRPAVCMRMAAWAVDPMRRPGTGRCAARLAGCAPVPRPRWV